MTAPVVGQYSGTVGQTVVTVQQFIDQGARLSGKLAEELTVEQVQASKQALFFLLSNLINQGVNYWGVAKQVYGLLPDQYEYLLPIGGNEILNALYRYMTRPNGSYSSSDGGNAGVIAGSDITQHYTQTVVNGSITVDFGTNNPQYIGSIGIMPYIAGGGTQTWSYQYQTSPDNSTWTTIYTATGVTVQDGQWIWTDIDPGANNEFYRIVATNNTTLSLRQWYLGTNSTEIMMARLNRDDYTNLPNKNFTANQPYQYWFNRTIPQSTINLWPAPSDPFVQMTVWYSRQVMDVGDLSGQIEIPQYFYQAIQFMLAHQMSMILPGVAPERMAYLETQSDKYFMMAESENRDKSPIYLYPNITGYTK
ncbi:MAG TPA: hypothetical protein PLQ34_09890 [Ferrovaceae bacterium]|nr:hypothetical protein [Ferrovaceae bacterium]